MRTIAGRSIACLLAIVAFSPKAFSGSHGNGSSQRQSSGQNPYAAPPDNTNHAAPYASNVAAAPSETVIVGKNLVAGPANIVLNVTPLGAVIPTGGGHYQTLPIISRGGDRTLVIAANGSRVQAFVDGQPGPVVNDIPVTQAQPIIGGGVHGSPLFSADLKRVAYIATLDNNKHAVVVDSAQSPTYDDVSWLGFALVGNHVAYLAQRGGEFFVDNGKAGMIYQSISPTSAVFSPDGQHFAYVGITNDVGVKPLDAQAGKLPPQAWCVVVDGIEQKHYDKIGTPKFSQDSKHIAYLAGVDGLNLTRAIVDDQEGPAYARVDQLAISDDASRCAYAGIKGGHALDTKYVLVDNGKEGPEYDGITSVCVSHNGQRVAYVAVTHSGQSIVVDNGTAGAQYQTCENLEISADGKTLMYRGRTPKGQFLVVNDQAFGPYTILTTAFSEDGGHWAGTVGTPAGGYAVLEDGKTIALSGIAPGTLTFQPGNGQLLMQCTTSYSGSPVTVEIKGDAISAADVPTSIVYSRNHQHWAKLFTSGFGTSEVKQQIAVDDKAAAASNYSSIRSIAISDDGQHLGYIGSYIGENGRALTHAVHDGAEGPGYFQIQDLALSADGRHVAYAAQKSNGHGIDCFVVIDGVAGPAFQDVLIDGPYAGQGIGANTEYRQVRFRRDGSLQFLATFNNQLYRCTYSAAAFNGLPSLAAHEAEKPGPRDLHKFEGAGTAIRMVIAPDETIYGLSAQDGKFKKGTFFSVKTDGSGFTVVHDFYGGDDDGENPMSLLLGTDGRIFGALERKVFHYDPKSKQYAMLDVNTGGAVGPNLLEGLASDGSIVGFCGMSVAEKAGAFSMAADGSNYMRIENGQFGRPLRQYSQIVPAKDGSFFALSFAPKAALVKFKSLKDEPTVLHKFAALPTDGTRPDCNMVLDSKGNLYGTTAAGGMSQNGVLYRTDPDGSNYQVVYNPDDFTFSRTFVPGDDGVLYGITKDGLSRIAPDGSNNPPAVVVAFDGDPYTQLRGATPNIFFHNGAIYGLHNKAVYKIVLPQAGSGSTGAALTVSVNGLDPQPTSAEAFTFTDPIGAAAPGTPTATAPPPSQVTPQITSQQPTSPPQDQADASQQPPPPPPPPQHVSRIDKSLKKAQDAADRLKHLFGQ